MPGVLVGLKRCVAEGDHGGRQDLDVAGVASVLRQPGTNVGAELSARPYEVARQLATLERIWNRDLSMFDPDGPFPDVEPDLSAPPIAEGMGRPTTRPAPDGAPLAGPSRLKQLEHAAVGPTDQRPADLRRYAGPIADDMQARVDEGVCDGFILVPHLVPTGLDEFVADAVPLLQERSALRAEYDTYTLRDHLGLRPRP